MDSDKDLQSNLLALLAEGPSTAADLVSALKKKGLVVTKSQVNKALYAMESKGLTKKGEANEWRIVKTQQPQNDPPAKPKIDPEKPSAGSHTSRDPACPKCGSPMVKRKRRIDGVEFLGCVSFPKCKGAKSLDGADQGAKPENPSVRTDSEGPLPRLPQTRFRKVSIRAHHRSSVCSIFASRGWILGDPAPKPRAWALEMASSSMDAPADRVLALCATLSKQLERGDGVLLDLEVEAFIAKNREVLSREFGLVRVSSFNPEAFVFDHESERDFCRTLESRFPGSLSVVCPQFAAEALAPELDKRDMRVDFAAMFGGSSVVIEVDGKQHQDEGARKADAERDAALKRNGVRVERVPVGDDLKQLAGLIGPIEHPRLSPEHFAHVISESILLGVRLGWLGMTGESWRLKFCLPTDSNPLRELTKVAVEGAFRHFSHLAAIYRLGPQLPKTVEVEFLPADLLPGVGQTPNGLTISLRPVPAGVLSERVLYYRELPFEGAVLIDPIDAMPDDLDPVFDSCRYLLDYLFRFPTFNEGQFEALARTLKGKDSLVLMPTGHGKSIIYQLSAMLRPGVCICVDPLKSLMDDQAFNLSRKGFSRVAIINSNMLQENRAAHEAELGAGQFHFVFVAPHRFQIQSFRDAIHGMVAFSPVSLVAIDEAHCVSEWGHGFMTAYLGLARAARTICASRGGIVPPIMGLTGTASRSVLKDVRRELEIFDFEAVITPTTFDRKNLQFRVEQCTSDAKEDKLAGVLKALPANFAATQGDFFSLKGARTLCGIVFCPHVKGQFGVAGVSEAIKRDFRIPEVGVYAGDAPFGQDKDRWEDLKQSVAAKFRENQLAIMVATKAFGMGIDKPNVRYTIHYGIPPSIENFYQEAGRAGRDGKKSICCVLASNDNPRRNLQLLGEGTTLEEMRKAIDGLEYSEKDDIARNLWFQANAFRGVDSELREVDELLEEIGDLVKSRKLTLPFGQTRDEREKALHRLVVIGLVTDYTIDHSRRQFTAVLRGFDPTHMREVFLGYVANYQESRARAIEGRIPGHNVIPKVFVRTMVSVLIDFVYETIELSRRRALLEVAEVCGPGANDKSVRERILSYLERSEFDEGLEAIREGPLELAQFSALFQDVVSPAHAKSLRGAVGRLLVDYPDSVALLFVRATAEALCPDCKTENVLEEFRKGFKAVSRYGFDFADVCAVFDYLLARIRKKSAAVAEDVTAGLCAKSEEEQFLLFVAQGQEFPHEAVQGLRRYWSLKAPKISQLMKQMERLST